jgi:hypothetical protein
MTAERKILEEEWRALSGEDREAIIGGLVTICRENGLPWTKASVAVRLLRAAAEPEAKAPFCTECLGKKWNTGLDGNPVSCSKCTVYP